MAQNPVNDMNNKIHLQPFRMSLLVVLCCLGAWCAHAATSSPGAERVLVIYNANYTGDEDGNGVQDSLQVAQYYAAKRGVPAQNLLGLPLADPYLYGCPYDKLQSEVIQPIQAKIAALGPTNIDILLMCYQTPVWVTGWDSYYGVAASVSVDNVLMALNVWDSASNNIRILNNPYSQASSYRGPSFGPDLGHFDHATYQYSGKDIYLVTRLDGSHLNTCLEMIDQALYADHFLCAQSGYYNGIGYVDSRYQLNGVDPTDEALAADPDVQSGTFWSYGNVDVNLAYAEHFILGAGFPLKWQQTYDVIGQDGILFSDGTPAEQAPRALWYCGWYNYGQYLDVWDWLPGSIASDLNSCNYFAYHARDNGATCVATVMGEPYTVGNPQGNVLLYYIFKGYNFAEAAGAATPSMGWQPQNLGDPLYAPMAPKTPVKDTRHPSLASTPVITFDGASLGARISFVVSDAVEPEVVKARIDY
jgi:uncharacterized protein (TIGR03790 family)